MLEGDKCEEDNEEIAGFVEEICASEDCLITLEYSPLQPGDSEHKYYALDLGFFFEINNEGECLIIADALSDDD